jgi:hypothetical protein
VSADDEKERERAFKRERDAVEAWKTGPIEEPPELIDPVHEELSDEEKPE